MSSPSPSEVTPPSRTTTRRTTSNTSPKYPNRLSNYAFEHIEQPPPPTHPSLNTIPLMTEPPRPSLTEFPTPIFTSLLDTDIDTFTNPTRKPANEDRTSLKGLLEATKRALEQLDKNSIPALNENDEEDHADREWAELCALRGLEVELEEMIRLGSSDGDVDAVSGHDKFDTETETRERRASRNGILRSRSNSSESDFSIAKKKKSVRFEEPVNLVGAAEEIKKSVGFDEQQSRADKPVPKMKKRVSFELEKEQHGEQIVKKKIVRFLDSKEEDGSRTQSRMSLHDDKSQASSEQEMVEKEDHAVM